MRLRLRALSTALRILGACALAPDGGGCGRVTRQPFDFANVIARLTG